ncbi:VOC family protein [Sphingomonas sp. 2SG]|uniref:VOC family protein n=1 Tax=Sphingomonas sp. 2SG TaxID=2502201 RepID=UPI0010FA21F1|nr:VOC family protein [Sphingomonas sp. 2SG]
MSIARAIDIAYVRMAAPDVERQVDFLRDFGLIDLGEHGGKRLLCAEDKAPFCYSLVEGEPGFLGFGLWVADDAALAALAAHDGSEVRPLDAPGGGHYVRMVDPDGFQIDAVADQSLRDAAVRPPVGWNESGAAHRIDRLRRIDPGPSRVLRLGHLAMVVSDFIRSETWYKDRFGFLTTDEFELEPGTSAGSFLRTDRGTKPSDHHTLVLFQSGTEPRLRHLAFEVGDVDDLMAGREHLIKCGHTPHWGVGRHLLGSQIFDYWFDPYGREHEHWTDGDQLSANTPPNLVGMDQVMGVQWGMERPTRV